MEWRNYYMDVMFVPLGLVMIIAYHIWLWHKTRTQPFTTTFGRHAHGCRLWVPTMTKDIDKKNLVAVQSLRNLIMGSTLMATSAILMCAGLGAVISSTYSVKTPINDTIFGAHGKFMVGLKYAILLTMFSFSFLCHTFSNGFLNQVNILISTPQHVNSLVTSEYVTQLLVKAILLNSVGNRLFYSALSLILWIFGPVLAFFSSMAMVLILYNLDFLVGNNNTGIAEP
ncbi:uncharacterized protein LOC109807117 [Cajanus cajan]|uniref:DUF599 domain-containing protein n=1 Tax=Cajanus cajan TaxID=3821 RepID=A0A151SMW7_CAJCA|nr:uncharacterized protein LOC109807117 [Cajanus cajan]KYP56089.1 hypothetical protein KK1_002319 [Cajanus cajan]